MLLASAFFSFLQIYSNTFIICTNGYFNLLITIDLTSCLKVCRSLESGAFFYLNMLRNCRNRLRAPPSILLIPLSFSALSFSAFSLSAFSLSAFSLSAFSLFSFSLSGLLPLRYKSECSKLVYLVVTETFLTESANRNQ